MPLPTGLPHGLPTSMPPKYTYTSPIEQPAMQMMMDDRALPDFITHHIDPLSGDDDSGDIDAGRGFESMPPGGAMSATMPDGSPVPEP